MSRLKQRYQEEVKKELQTQFGYKNTMMTPKLTKVVLSMGVAEAVNDKNILQDHSRELAMLTGQRPIVCKARKSIANFKLREEMPIGLKVTLRGKRMYDFVDRFINIATPRIRDFRGFRPKGDSSGNYSLGLESQDIYPEVDLDQLKRSQGMNITFVTTAQRDEECLALLRGLGMPFIK